MNLPNILSLSRVPFLFVILGLLMCDFKYAHTLAFVIFVVASLTDWLDGFCARRFNMISNSGKLLDALTDKIFTLGLFFVLLNIGVLPSWGIYLVLLMLCREFLIVGLRMVAVNKKQVLAAERAGKIKTVCQILSLGIFVLYATLVRDFNLKPADLFMRLVFDAGIVTFIISVFLTLSSGVSYMIKYGYLLKEEKLAK